MNDITPLPSINGCLDIVTPEGVVEGWCWDQTSPGLRPEVMVMVDGVTAGSALAGSFRPDLLAAGIGDGGYGFSFVIPWTMLFQKRTVTVAVFEVATRQRLGEPFVLRSQVAAGLDDRLAELEGKIRLLESRLAEIAGRSEAEPDTGTLFQTVGTFFTQLARDAREGRAPGAGHQLGTAIEVIEATHPALTVPVCEAPLVTICIDACAPLTALHACVATLLGAQAGGQADMILLDPGTFDDAALLPVVVHNIRYIRALHGPAQERNAIARAARTPFVIFVSGRATVAPGWLTEILATFERHERAGAVGGCVVRDDGLLDRGGLLLSHDRHLIDLASGRSAASVAGRRARPVHAVPDDGVAIRRTALLDCDGLDERFDTLSAAVIDLCFRLGERGWSVQYQPYATMAWRHPEPGEAHVPEIVPQTDETLRTRWLASTRPVPPLTLGQALLVGAPGEDIAAPLRAADRLHAIRYAVSYTAATLDEGSLRDLARRGVAIVPWQDMDSPDLPPVPDRFDMVWAPSKQAAGVLHRTAPAVQILVGDCALLRFCDEPRPLGAYDPTRTADAAQ